MIKKGVQHSFSNPAQTLLFAAERAQVKKCLDWLSARQTHDLRPQLSLWAIQKSNNPPEMYLSFISSGLAACQQESADL